MKLVFIYWLFITITAKNKCSKQSTVVLIFRRSQILCPCKVFFFPISASGFLSLISHFLLSHVFPRKLQMTACLFSSNSTIFQVLLDSRNVSEQREGTKNATRWMCSLVVRENKSPDEATAAFFADHQFHFHCHHFKQSKAAPPERGKEIHPWRISTLLIALTHRPQN